jgi:hypothetical protein
MEHHRQEGMSMTSTSSRREFVRSATTVGAAMGVGNLGFLARLRPLSAAETEWDPDIVQFDAGIEPLVKLLEETPRDRVLEVFAARINDGTEYNEVLAALHLAGIRNIPPRPDVGWKFHAVLVLHSAHLASMAATGQDRWMPIFFALDFFKSQQAYDVRESDWSMSQPDEASIPEARVSRQALIQAMDAWDDDAADAAAAGFVRTSKAQDVFEMFAYYGMRDFRNIGHKPIHMANSWRTLERIGWRHAEPMMRSLVYAFLNHHDEPNPSTSELEADAPWRHNQELIEKIGEKWSEGEVRSSATSELLSTLRSGTWSEASGHVVELLNDGVSPQSILDGLHCGAAELLMRQPGIVSLHGVTATNALAYAYRTSTKDRTRRLLLLQNAAFLVQFREYLKSNGDWSDRRIDKLRPISLGVGGTEALDLIFEQVSENRADSISMALDFLQTEGNRPEDFMAAARRLILVKFRNGHDYKFSSAAFEDYYLVSPEWRNRYLASSIYYLRGSGDADNRLVKRMQAALKA